MRSEMKGLGHATVGLDVVLSLAAGFLGGRWLDGQLGTAPYLTIVGFGFGLATAIRFLWRAVRTMRAEAAKEEREQGNPAPIYDPDEVRPGRVDRDDDVAPDEDGETAAQGDQPSRSDPPRSGSSPRGSE